MNKFRPYSFHFTLMLPFKTGFKKKMLPFKIAGGGCVAVAVAVVLALRCFQWCACPSPTGLGAAVASSSRSVVIRTFPTVLRPSFGGCWPAGSPRRSGEGMGQRRKPRSACGPMTTTPSGAVYLLEGVIVCPSFLLSGELSG